MNTTTGAAPDTDVGAWPPTLRAENTDQHDDPTEE
jgi:hypothetical protein